MVEKTLAIQVRAIDEEKVQALAQAIRTFSDYMPYEITEYVEVVDVEVMNTSFYRKLVIPI